MRTLHKCRSRLAVFILTTAILAFAGNSRAHSPHDHIEAFVASPDFSDDQTILIVVRNHLLRSTDAGKSWSRIARGLDNRFQFTALAMGGGMAYLASKGDGVFRSSDNGESWERANQGFGTSNIRFLHVAGKHVFAGSKAKGVYRAEIGKENWKAVIPRAVEDQVTAFASSEDGSVVVAADAQGGVVKSSDAGATWGAKVEIPDAGKICSLLLKKDGSLILGTEKRGVLMLGADSEISELAKLEGGAVTELAVFEQEGATQLLATTWDEGFFVRPKEADAWEKRSEGTSKHVQADERKLPHFTDLAPIKGTKGTVFLGAYDGLFRTDDLGRNWKEIETLPLSMILDFDVAPAGGGKAALMAGTYWRGPILSVDSGSTWKAIGLDLASGWRVKPGDKMMRVQSVAISPNFAEDGTLFVGGRNSMTISRDRGESWKSYDLAKSLEGEDLIVDRMVFSSNFAKDRVMFIAARAGHDDTRRPAVFRSDDGGESFKLSHDSKGDEYAHSIVISPAFAEDGTVFWASGADRGGKVFRTEDGGKTWVESGEGLIMDVQGAELAISPNYAEDKTVFAGTSDGLFKSVDGGKNWALLESEGLPRTAWSEAVDVSPNYKTDKTLAVSVRGFGHFISTDGGESFQPIAEDLMEGNHLLTKAWYYSPGKVLRFSPYWSEDKSLFGTTGLEVMRSTNQGKTWEMLGAREAADALEGFRWNASVPLIGAAISVVAVFSFVLLKKRAKR